MAPSFRSFRLLLLALIAGLGPLGYAQPTGAGTGAPGSAEAEALFVRALTQAFLDDHEQAVALLGRVLDLRPHEPSVLAALAESHQALGQSAEALYYAAEAVEHGRDVPAHYATLAGLQAESDQPEAAVATYAALLRMTPEDPDALLALARLQEQVGRPADALETYRRLLDASGEDAALMLRMEALYARLGDAPNALRMLESAAEAFPGERMLLSRLGLAYRDAGRLPEAADAFERLLALDPGDAEAVQFLAGVLDTMGETARADSLRAAGRASADTPEERLRQAALLYARIADDPNAADEARRLLEPLADADEAPAEALFLLGDLLYQDREYERAAAVLTRALAEDPRKPGAWEQSAASFLHTGQVENAVATAEEALLLFPGQVGLLRLHAYALSKADRPREALDPLTEALRILAEDEPEKTAERARLLSLKALLHDELGEAAEADAAFEAALALDPENPLVLNNYAYVLAERGERLAEALPMAERAVAARPDEASFLDTLGWVLFKLGRLDAAADAIERAIAADDQFALLFEHLGEVYAAQGRADEARAAWQRALDLDPSNEALRAKLGGR